MSTSPPAPPGRTADDLAWRDHLLASLRDCGVQRAPRHGMFQWVITIIVVAMILVVSRVCSFILSENLGHGDPVSLMVPYLLWYAFVVFVLVRVRNRFIRKAWQANARSAREGTRAGPGRTARSCTCALSSSMSGLAGPGLGRAVPRVDAAGDGGTGADQGSGASTGR